MKHREARIFFILTGLLVAGGFFVFLSASLGLLGREGELDFFRTALKQGIAVMIGLVAFLITARTPYTFWRRYAFLFFIGAVLLNLALFIPGLGLSAGGARRWLLLGPLSIQPSEFLKIAFVIYFGAWLAQHPDRFQHIRTALLPLLATVGITVALLVAEPDIDTLVVILAAAGAMFLVGGGRLQHLGALAVVGLILVAGIIYHKPYIRDRIQTYLHPQADTLGSGYQINQSLIAIGSGQLVGRGFGQSVQKFNFLPEPTGDSIFAVAAEEFGFAGAVTLIVLFILFALTGLRIAANCSGTYGRLIVTGIVILITCQSFVNMGAMLGLIPLSGLPLVFVSLGGTSIVVSLGAAGIVAAVAERRK